MLSRRFALLAVLTLAAALVVAAPAPAQQPSGDDAGERSITVSGDGALFADNDIAIFRLSVTTRRRTAGAALRANSRTMRRITAAVRARGVAPGDIRTDVVSLDRASVRRRTHFVARNGVAVTIRDLAAAGSIVDVGVRAGATNVYGPEFGLADASAIYRDALALAFADARTKAERLAREAGVTLGPVLRIRESGIDEFDESGGGGARLNAGDDAGQRAPISPGRTRVFAGVTVTFATS
ncbi:MAG TPA: SIMPL domain-containing protein [Solirubrobacteraceae bacterium]|jgi:hypothetical protein|nr:SIMPL domain-containing protein [Solirubrobacteraceae bacterium]